MSVNLAMLHDMIDDLSPEDQQILYSVAQRCALAAGFEVLTDEEMEGVLEGHEQAARGETIRFEEAERMLENNEPLS